jgi:hypothetical protein
MSTVRFEEWSRAVADATPDRPGMFAVTIDEAFQLGQLVNGLRLGSAMEQIGATS